MRISPIDIQIDDKDFKFGIMCIFYNPCCYSWDLLSFGTHKQYDRIDGAMGVFIQIFGKRFMKILNSKPPKGE
jgi:hypothetical protein